ncbi:unnamed protein product [Caenorhabditis auriculariae]|uniref:Uncharacterized protein n=1 Tax=Caenorhabditis auriculariae TaxID=2777116 RepID=A0A8S1GT16_9PELO|nr:unnamed protein product [Caenorhabditis auriculariae]
MLQRFLPSFMHSPTSPHHIAKAFKQALEALQKGTKSDEDIQKNINKSFEAVKEIILGTPEHPPTPEAIALFIREIVDTNALQLLITNLSKFDFESRKDAVQIFVNILRRQFGKGYNLPVTDYLIRRRELVCGLVKGYEYPEIAAHCGQIIRECCEFESLHKLMLYDESFYDYFRHVQNNAFDIAADAFMTLKTLLTRHHLAALDYAEIHFDRLFAAFKNLLVSPNFFVKSQSLKLLCTFLLNRIHHPVVETFISSQDNLVMIMECLRSESGVIRVEAFHVFKIFVLHPKKAQGVHEILFRNKEKLLLYFGNFGSKRGESPTDDDSALDLMAVVKTIEELHPYEPLLAEHDLHATALRA